MAADRSLTVVSPPAVRSPDAFATCVQQALETSGDAASEAFWQDVARLILVHWKALSADQPPAQSLAMVKQ